MRPSGSVLQSLMLGDAGRLPMWVPIGLAEPSEPVQVLLEGLGDPIDVTCNNVVVDMHPLSLAIRLADARVAGGSRRPRLWLSFWERASGQPLGHIRLEPSGRIPLAYDALHLFSTCGCTNLTAGAPRVRAAYLYEAGRLLFDRNPFNEKMNNSELFCMWLLYCRPRPLALVSFVHEGAGNILPMDLMGDTDSPYFLLSVDRRRPSLPAITASGRVALSSMPLHAAPHLFALGGNHRMARVDWAALPFATVPSAEYGIPTPADALDVRELEIRQIGDAPTHRVLIATTTRWERRAEGGTLCLLHRLYHHTLMRQGRAAPHHAKN